MGTLLSASKMVNLERNTENEEYVHVSSPDVGQNHNMKRTNKCFENVRFAVTFQQITPATANPDSNLQSRPYTRLLVSNKVCVHDHI